MKLDGFLGPSYTSRSLSIACDRTVNLYPELLEMGEGRDGEKACLLATPGYRRVATATGVGRGIYSSSSGRLFAVIGDGFYEITAGGITHLRGTLRSSIGRVDFSDNGLEMVIVDGPRGYIYTFNSRLFTDISDNAGWRGADRVGFLDGYAVFQEPGTQLFYYTALYDWDTLSPLDFQSAEGAPDKVVSLLVDHRELWLLGSRTVEVFWNSGGVQTFERRDGAFIEIGCASPHCARSIGNTVIWLGDGPSGRGIVWSVEGYSPKRISTHAVEQSLQRGDVNKATSYIYQRDGHAFYVLHVPGTGTTWVYDLATQAWHERQRWNNGVPDRDLVEDAAFAYGQWWGISNITPYVYQIDETYCYHDTEPIVYDRVRRLITTGHPNVIVGKFQVDMEVGIANTNGQGEDPQVMLKYSNDGGRTWSKELWSSAGLVGQTRRRVTWRRLGAATDKVFWVRITDPIKPILVGTDLDASAAGKE